MRAVIWDLGGTLVDTYPDVDRALARAIQDPPSDALLHEVALLTRVSSGHAVSTLAARHAVPEPQLRAAYESTKEQWRTDPAPVMAGAREVIAAVHEAGGLNLVATHRERGSAAALLAALDLRLDDMVCAPDGYPRKPDPAMHLALLARHGLAAADCLAVGDRSADVEAAAAAGVRAVLLQTPGITLEAGRAAERIDRLEQLLALLRD